MGAKKIIPKDWRTQNARGSRAGLKSRAEFSDLEVTRSEDLPKLLTTKEAAEFLRRHEKTIEEYRRDGRLRFVKLGGRYFTTPELIAEHLENESKR